MNLPNLVTNAILAKLASPEETHCVRVIARRCLNQRPLAIRGRHRTYHAEHVAECGYHALDVPLTVWMDGIEPGTYRDNKSIAQDLQATCGPATLPLIFTVLPWRGAKAVTPVVEAPAAPQADVFTPLEELFAKMGAPAEVVEALKLAKDGHAGALRQFVDGCFVGQPGPPPVPDPVQPSPEALRMRKLREAKAAKRAAQLQPA